LFGISGENDNLAPFFDFFFQEKNPKRHYFDFRFRWALPNIRFRQNIRPKGSAETTSGRELLGSYLEYSAKSVGKQWEEFSIAALLKI
jgi:hypothetical protein